MGKHRHEIAHEKAMVKFLERWKKWITGFDFTVPEYRKELFIRELLFKELIYEEIAETYVEIKKRKRSLWQRIKSLNFRKYGKRYVVGVGIEDMVREDFFDNEGMPVYTQNVVCFSIAPTQELFEEREARR